ncbi:MAG TPA: DUF2946 family protein [Burkholderiales bacterium]|nr:DUF2946 family protein [Burkholderiales bacterium]
MKRKAAAWAAILGIVLNTLWPLLAAADPRVQDPSGTEVCTAKGIVAVNDGDRQLPSPQGPSHRLTPHCAFCTLGVAHGALHPAIPSALCAQATRHEVCAAYRFALPPWFLSACLRSRSPPAPPGVRS